MLGGGLSSLVAQGTGGVDFKTFLFPGVLSMSVLFTAAFAGTSMVWDREFGFLREMLVAPVSTAAILTGKCLGGATVATIQSVVVIALAGLVGVPYDPLMIVDHRPAVHRRLHDHGAGPRAGLPRQAGAIGDAAGADDHHAADVPERRAVPAQPLPGWLTIVTHLNPMTYAVEPVRWRCSTG